MRGERRGCHEPNARHGTVATTSFCEARPCRPCADSGAGLRCHRANRGGGTVTISIVPHAPAVHAEWRTLRGARRHHDTPRGYGGRLESRGEIGFAA